MKTICQFSVVLLGLPLATGLVCAPAQAGVQNSQAGFTFSVDGSCTVQGNIISYGTLPAGTTFNTLLTDFGRIDGGVYTAGAFPLNRTLGTINCTPGVIWNAAIIGRGTDGNEITVNYTSGPQPVRAMAAAAVLDSTQNNYGSGLATGYSVIDQPNVAGASVNGVGTGADQTLVGGYGIDATSADSATANSQLKAGMYDGSGGTLTVNFTVPTAPSSSGY